VSAELDALLAELGDGSLMLFMDQLETLELQVAERAVLIPEIDASAVSVDRWKPPQPPSWPAIYNVLPDAPFNPALDTATVEDLMQLRARIAVRHTNQRAELRRWELMADVFRAIVDPALRRRQALTASRNPNRRSMRWALDTWDTPGGRVQALCMEFSIDAPLRRQIARL
jgi:hypothetical protein